MNGQSVLTAASRRGGPRFELLALTLVAFAALHAFGSFAGDGTHCGSASALMMATDSHSTAESRSPDHHATAATAHDDRARADATRPAHESGDAMTGCLLALLGALALIGLRLLRRLSTDTTPAQLRHASTWLHAARAPPAPLFLSLCVFRL